jgi:hypothetical protein
LSSKTVDTIKGIIADAIIDLSSNGNEEEESVTKFPERGKSKKNKNARNCCCIGLI